MKDKCKHISLFSTESYFDHKKKTLEEKLKDIKIEEDDIIKDKTKKIIRDQFLGIFKITEVIKTVLDFNDEIEKEIREKKKEYLLSHYLDKSEKSEIALQKLIEFMYNPQGNILFNKILRILDNNLPDRELTKHLSSSLNYIIENDFTRLFKEHRYALNQIELLSVQALTLLCDHMNWPDFKLGGIYQTNDTLVTSDWLPEFSQKYCECKNIKDKDIFDRIKSSLGDLKMRDVIEAHLIVERKGESKAIPSSIGETLLQYIN